jgi:hypothetical protein
VRWAIDVFGTFKAAVEDGIYPGLLQHGIEIIIGHFTKKLAACLACFMALCGRTQGALNCVENWCREIGLSVNADKTTMILFTNNRNIGIFYIPRLVGTELKMTDQMKYLGVILDKSLIERRILKIGYAKQNADMKNKKFLDHKLSSSLS